MLPVSFRVAGRLLSHPSPEIQEGARNYYAWVVGFARNYLREPSAEEQLTVQTMRGVTNAREMAGGDQAEWANILAVHAGGFAARFGMTLQQMEKWLGSNYGAIWVREGGLNPGLDLKQVAAIMKKSYLTRLHEIQEPQDDEDDGEDDERPLAPLPPAPPPARPLARPPAPPPAPPEDEYDDEADKHDENAARFTRVDDVIRGLFAGNATITLVSNKTGRRFTYNVTKAKDIKNPEKKQTWFVSVLSGPSNENDYEYVGFLRNREGRYEYTHAARSRYSRDAPSVKTFDWFIRKIQDLGAIPPEVQVWHEGRCMRCGRKLTVPSSIESGIGPECAKKE